MSHIVIGAKIPGGQNLSIDVDELLATRLLIQANSGGGKSWLLRRIAEQLFGKVPVIIIDPEGEFATLREKYDFVLVGEGGDVPAHVRSAALLAETLLKYRMCAVCDLYEAFRKTPIERHNWVKAFLGGLLDAPKSVWGETIIIVDEAHVFCPEQGESPAEGVMVGVATAGRKRGFCPIWATQRLALVDKSATSQLQNRMVGLTFEDVDVTRAVNLLSVAKEDQHEFKEKVKLLNPGEFYAFGRAISRHRELVKVGDVATSHPKMGKAARHVEAPPPPEKIKALLPKLADLPKTVEEKARTEAEYKKRIRELERELREKPVATKEIRVSVADPRAVKEVANKFSAQIRESQAALNKMTKAMRVIAQTAAQACDAKVPKFEPISVSQAPSIQVPPKREMVHRPAVVRHPSAEESNGQLPGGEKTTLIEIAKYPEGVDRSQLSILSGYKRSTRDAYVLRLSKRGYVSFDGEKIVATEAGIAALGDAYETAPPTGEELQEYWLRRLPSGEKKILESLIAANGEPLEADSLDEHTGFARSSRDAYILRLSAKKLVERVGRGQVKAAEMLFQ